MMRGKSIFILVLLFIFWRIFTPGNHLATDLHTKSFAELLEQVNLPFAWSDAGSAGLGHYNVPLLWNWPVGFVFGLFSKLGFSYNFMLLIFGYFVAFGLSIIGINKLLKYYKVGIEGRASGILLYLLNSYFILLLDGGQLNLAMAYGALPLALYYFFKAVTVKSKFRDYIKFGLSAYLLSIFDIRIIYLLFIFIGVNFVFRRKIKKYFLAGISAGFILLFLHFYWIYPSIFLRTPQLPGTLGRVSQVSFLNFTELKHSVSLLQPHWHMNDFGQVARFNKLFLLIPIYFGGITLLSLKNKKIIFWVILASIFVFLTKGNNSPKGEIYEWLFVNLPGFSMFRDSTKFFYGVALSYSILLGMATEKLHFGFLKKIYVGLFILILLGLNYPVISGKLTGTFRTVEYESEYLRVNEIVENDNEFGRVLWIPTKAPLGYSSPQHLAVEMTELTENQWFNNATVGKYESFNWLREGEYISDLLDIYGVAYIVYSKPSELKRELSDDEKEYYDEFSTQIESLDFVIEKINDKPVNTYKLKENKDLFFVANNMWNVNGSADFLNELHEENVDLSKNIINFNEQSSDKDYVFLANNLDFEPDESGWWKRETVDSVWWRDFLEQKYSLYNNDFDYGGGWAISEGENELEIGLNKSGELFARVMKSSKGGKIRFNDYEIETKIIDPELVEIYLAGNSKQESQVFNYEKADFEWVKVGEVNEGRLVIRTEGEINVINALSFIEPNLVNDVNFEKMKDVFSNVELNYKRVNPVKYKIIVNGIKDGKKKYLVFSENFDEFWQLDGQKAKNVYGGLNGFEISENGEYELYYTAQNYVNRGFVVSMVGYIVASGFILHEIRSRIRDNK